MLIVGGGIALVLANRPESDAQKAADAAVAYGRTEMLWQKGPAATSTRLVPLRKLASTLERSTSASIAPHVNVPSLIERYGPNHRVAIVVLSGEFNSLPPDEGVELTTAVAIVDVPSDHVILVAD